MTPLLFLAAGSGLGLISIGAAGSVAWGRDERDDGNFFAAVFTSLGVTTLVVVSFLGLMA